MTHLQKQIRAGRSRAFTLVELLMVMGVMLVIMGLAVVAFPNIGKAGNLTSGAQSFVDALNQGRQFALALNRTVEVRFYYLPGATDGTKATQYRAMRIIVSDASGNTSTNNGNATVYAAGASPQPVVRLPAGVIVYSSAQAGTSGFFTTLLPEMDGASSSTAPTANWGNIATTTLKAAYGTEYFPGNGTVVPVAYAAIQFKPNGGTNLDPLGTLGTTANSSDEWFMTLMSEADIAKVTPSQPGLNFVTLVIDPFSGRARMLRPGS